MSSLTPGSQETGFSVGYDVRAYSLLDDRIRTGARDVDLILVVNLSFKKLTIFCVPSSVLGISHKLILIACL